MGFHIKPLLGQGTIKLASVWDEAIDWDGSACSIDEYIADPIANLSKLAPLADQQIVFFRFRAPDEIDLGEVDTEIVRVMGGGTVTERRLKKEHVSLFRRCLEGIESYLLNGEKVEVFKEPTVDGRKQASLETMQKIPYDVAVEVGSYLRRSQALTDDLKNESGPPAGPTTGENQTA